jgi:hypothetical protein
MKPIRGSDPKISYRNGAAVPYCAGPNGNVKFSAAGCPILAKCAWSQGW